MKKQFSKITAIILSGLLPSFAFAACTTDPNTIQNLVCQVTDIAATYIVPLLTVAAFIFFLWRVLKLIQDSDSGPKRTENRQSVMWSIVALTVMVAVWGIVAVLGSTLGIDTGFVPQVKPPLTKSGWTGYTGGGSGSNSTLGGNGSNGGSTLGGNGSGGSTLGGNGSGSTLGGNGSDSTLGGNGSVQ